MRLIDVDALYKAIISSIDYCEDILEIIDRQPTAEPEIIRCKDCKQFRRWIDTDICFCDITESEISDNDFCSRAERGTDE